MLHRAWWDLNAHKATNMVKVLDFISESGNFSSFNVIATSNGTIKTSQTYSICFFGACENMSITSIYTDAICHFPFQSSTTFTFQHILERLFNQNSMHSEQKSPLWDEKYLFCLILFGNLDFPVNVNHVQYETIRGITYQVDTLVHVSYLLWILECQVVQVLTCDTEAEISVLLSYKHNWWCQLCKRGLDIMLGSNSVVLLLFEFCRFWPCLVLM